MPMKRRSLVRLAAAIAATVLAGCAAGSPNAPRNGAGQLVDPVSGTPSPGQTMGYN